jgi:hypothetical protein
LAKTYTPTGSLRFDRTSVLAPLRSRFWRGRPKARVTLTTVCLRVPLLTDDNHERLPRPAAIPDLKVESSVGALAQ